MAVPLRYGASAYDTHQGCYDTLRYEDEDEKRDAEGFEERQVGGAEAGDTLQRTGFAGGGDSGYGATEHRDYAGYAVTRHEAAEGGEGSEQRGQVCVCPA